MIQFFKVNNLSFKSFHFLSFLFAQKMFEFFYLTRFQRHLSSEPFLTFHSAENKDLSSLNHFEVDF